MGRALPPLERFMRHVDKQPGPDGCWIWTGAQAGTKSRYGMFRPGTHACDPKVPAHRWLYEQVVARIPDGLEPDHLCRRPLCVRPGHIEPVTHAENMRRSRLTVCKRCIHDLTDPAACMWDKRGVRRGCRGCRVDAWRRRAEKRAEEARVGV